MKRANLFGDSSGDEEEVGFCSFPDEGGRKKRKQNDKNKGWSQFLLDKKREFIPSGTPQCVKLTTTKDKGLVLGSRGNEKEEGTVPVSSRVLHEVQLQREEEELQLSIPRVTSASSSNRVASSFRKTLEAKKLQDFSPFLNSQVAVNIKKKRGNDVLSQEAICSPRTSKYLKESRPFFSQSCPRYSGITLRPSSSPTFSNLGDKLGDFSLSPLMDNTSSGRNANNDEVDSRPRSIEDDIDPALESEDFEDLGEADISNCSSQGTSCSATSASSLARRAWTKLSQEKYADFRPQEDNDKLPQSPSSQTNSCCSTSTIEISEFESPKKGDPNEVIINKKTDTMAFLDADTSDSRCIRRRLGDQLRAVTKEYESSVRRFPQDYRLNKFDEEKAMTLVIRHICGREDKLIWTIARHIEGCVDRCVMFRPLYPQDIAVGVVLKLYEPWLEIDFSPLPVVVCTDFYRIADKRDAFFGVPKYMIEELLSSPIPFQSNYTTFISDGDDLITSTLAGFVPYRLSNRNTVKRQMKINLGKPWIDLDVVVRIVELRSKVFLLCDSDNFYCQLQLPECDNNEIGLKRNLLQVLKEKQYIRFHRLGVVSKTNISENVLLFRIFRLLGSSQALYYTLGLRHDTEWEVKEYLDIPYISHPGSRQRSQRRGNSQLS